MNNAARTFHVRVGETRVRVRELGAGPPLLMIAGIGGNLDMWAPLIPELPGRRLVMFDVPGTGESGRLRYPPLMLSYAHFTRRLLRELGHDRVDVLAFSWGGLLAQQFAIQYPGCVGRLVLAGTAPGMGGIPPRPRVLGRMLTTRRYHSRSYFRAIAADFYGGHYRHDPLVVDEDMDRRMAHPPGILGYAAQLCAVAGYSSLPGPWLISTPTLILGGDDDPIIATANLRMLAGIIRDSELHIVRGGGHMLLVDSPKLVGPLIMDFLERRVAPAIDARGGRDGAAEHRSG
jgi:pimeloyl-ACP methyl ester carboxylesterase